MLKDQQFRCLIIGGDEKPPGCGPDCNTPHLTGNCLKCGRGWGSHSGHNCSYGGQRGSWLLTNSKASTAALDDLKIIETLTDETDLYARANYGILPPERACVYSAHCNMKEEKRSKFWRIGSVVTDDHKVINAYIRCWNSSMSYSYFHVPCLLISNVTILRFSSSGLKTFQTGLTEGEKMKIKMRMTSTTSLQMFQSTKE